MGVGRPKVGQSGQGVLRSSSSQRGPPSLPRSSWARWPSALLSFLSPKDTCSSCSGPQKGHQREGTWLLRANRSPQLGSCPMWTQGDQLRQMPFQFRNSHTCWMSPLSENSRHQVPTCLFGNNPEETHFVFQHFTYLKSPVEHPCTSFSPVPKGSCLL